MKNLIVLLMLIIGLGATAQAHERCRVVLKDLPGIYRTYCPTGTVMTANATRVSHVGYSIFVNDQLVCTKLTIVCDKPEEIVDTEEDLDYDNDYEK